MLARVHALFDIRCIFCLYSLEAPDAPAVFIGDMEIVLDIEPAFIGFEPTDKRIAFHLRHSVTVTPKYISGVKFRTVCLIFLTTTVQCDKISNTTIPR